VLHDPCTGEECRARVPARDAARWWAADHGAWWRGLAGEEGGEAKASGCGAQLTHAAFGAWLVGKLRAVRVDGGRLRVIADPMKRA